jgi:hypothetical protein
MLQIVSRVAAGAVVATLALWAGLTAYNFVSIINQFGGIFENALTLLTHPDALCNLLQMSFYNSLGDVGFTYHDLGMTGPFVLLYALVISAYTLFKTGQ